jgi:hypothetical protein
VVVAVAVEVLVVVIVRVSVLVLLLELVVLQVPPAVCSLMQATSDAESESAGASSPQALKSVAMVRLNAATSRVGRFTESSFG